MSKLLNKTLAYYVISAIVLLALSAPLFYWLAQKLYLDDVDEAIVLRKDEFNTHTLKTLQSSEIQTWNRFNRDIRILPDTVKQAHEKIILQNFYDSLSREWEPYRILYTNVQIAGSPHTLMIRLNLVESEDLIETTGLLYLIILTVSMIGFVIVSRVISTKMWQPFYNTLAIVSNFDIEQHEQPRFPRTTILEFRQLNEALEKLIEQNLRAFQTQKEFTENASHELQTPLAVFQSKLDTLLQNPDLTAQQAGTVQQLYEAVARLSRINKNLLLLAKMGNNQYADRENISITGTIREVLPYFDEQAAEKQLQLKSDLAQEITISANKGLAEILVNNLLLNAIRHNVKGGNITIQTTSNQLIICNTGTDMPLQTAGLFQRFGKTTENPANSGLGLAIVKKIADLNKWSVSYTFSDGRHCFTVQF